jgi:BlaI family penicillinase repressor
VTNPKSDLPPLTDAQLEVMHCVWDRGETTVTDVWQQVSSEREIARNTVLTVIDRLAKRGWLEKKSVGNTHLYQATVEREQALGNVVRRMVETAFAGSADRMVMALLDGRGVSNEEAIKIRRLIDESREQKRNKRK